MHKYQRRTLISLLNVCLNVYNFICEAVLSMGIPFGFQIFTLFYLEINLMNIGNEKKREKNTISSMSGRRTYH